MYNQIEEHGKDDLQTNRTLHTAKPRHKTRFWAFWTGSYKLCQKGGIFSAVFFSFFWILCIFYAFLGNLSAYLDWFERLLILTTRQESSVFIFWAWPALQGVMQAASLLPNKTGRWPVDTVCSSSSKWLKQLYFFYILDFVEHTAVYL